MGTNAIVRWLMAAMLSLGSASLAAGDEPASDRDAELRMLREAAKKQAAANEPLRERVRTLLAEREAERAAWSRRERELLSRLEELERAVAALSRKPSPATTRSAAAPIRKGMTLAEAETALGAKASIVGADSDGGELHVIRKVISESDTQTGYRAEVKTYTMVIRDGRIYDFRVTFDVERAPRIPNPAVSR